MSTVHYSSQQLNPKEWGDKIRAYVDACPRYETLMMRQAVSDLNAFPGWWFASTLNGEIKALACVIGTTANVYGEPQALGTMADGMVRMAGGGQRRAKSGRHAVYGEEENADTFWERFKNVGRSVQIDRRQYLISAKAMLPAKSAYEARPATSAELPVVIEFSGEQGLDAFGADPRRMAPEAHKQRCAESIAEGVAMLGKQKGKPAFYAECSRLDEETIHLRNIYLPRAFRRPLVIAGTLAHAVNHALTLAPEVVFFVDAESEEVDKALAKLELSPICTYRMRVLA